MLFFQNSHGVHIYRKMMVSGLKCSEHLQIFFLQENQMKILKIKRVRTKRKKVGQNAPLGMEELTFQFGALYYAK